MSLRNETGRCFAKKVEITDLEGLEIASPSKETAETERYTIPSNIITISAKKLSDGSPLQ